MTLLSKKILPLTLVLAGSVALTACSSKPSPWAESSSPWDNRAESQEPEPLDVSDIEAVEPAPEGDAIEPIEVAAIEEAPESTQSEMVVEEPPAPEPEPVIEEAPAAPMGGSLAEQPASYYAVQVVASSSMDQLHDFANRNQLSDQWVAQTMVDGKLWYVLMLGVYPTRDEAEQALQSVQDMETQPWIRTVGSVQAVMN